MSCSDVQTIQAGNGSKTQFSFDFPYIFKSEIHVYFWNTTTKELTMLQRPRTKETLLLFAYNYRPDEQLLSDYLASQWIKDYTLATCKFMLGEARSKFAQIAGPQGGSSLNGDALKAEAQAELEKLEMDVSQQVSGGMGYGFTIG